VEALDEFGAVVLEQAAHGVVQRRRHGAVGRGRFQPHLRHLRPARLVDHRRGDADDGQRRHRRQDGQRERHCETTV